MDNYKDLIVGDVVEAGDEFFDWLLTDPSRKTWQPVEPANVGFIVSSMSVPMRRSIPNKNLTANLPTKGVLVQMHGQDLTLVIPACPLGKFFRPAALLAQLISLGSGPWTVSSVNLTRKTVLTSEKKAAANLMAAAEVVGVKIAGIVAVRKGGGVIDITS